MVRTGFGFTMNICLAVMCYLLVFAEPVVLLCPARRLPAR